MGGVGGAARLLARKGRREQQNQRAKCVVCHVAERRSQTTIKTCPKHNSSDSTCDIDWGQESRGETRNCEKTEAPEQFRTRRTIQVQRGIRDRIRLHAQEPLQKLWLIRKKVVADTEFVQILIRGHTDQTTKKNSFANSSPAMTSQ